MSIGTVQSSNEAQSRICRALLHRGAEVDPRGMKTRELLNISFSLTNPRNRLTTIRHWNPALAVGELAWHVRGETSVEPLTHYAKRWRDFADAEGQVRGSCYGEKIFGSSGGANSQWSNVRELLIRDLNSRRAVLNFRSESSVSEATNDLSCTNSLQFVARDGRLHAFVSMRSNDVIWGVPYDVFLFTCLQEMMAAELGLGLGEYHHHAASMHFYERHLKVASKVALTDSWSDGAMAAIESAEDIYQLASVEPMHREGRSLGEFMPTAFQMQCLRMLDSSLGEQKAA